MNGTLLSRTATIRNKRGLHARAAAMFVKVAGRFDARIQVSRSGQTVSGLSIMGLMMLAAGPGAEIRLEVDGAEAEQALSAICEMIDGKFEED